MAGGADSFERALDVFSSYCNEYNPRVIEQEQGRTT